MLLHGLPAARERVLVDLVLDLLVRVGHVDGGLRVAGAHLARLALQRREESALDERRLQVAQARRGVARHAEVRVLVDGARDEAAHIAAGAEHVREGRREARRGLHGREGDLSNVVLALEAEDAAHLVERHALGDAHHVVIERPAEVVEVRENERALRVEAARDDVLAVGAREALRLLDAEVLPHALLVIRQLDHQRHLERVLQPLGELEGDEVAHVQRLRARAAAGVQVEGLALLVRVQNLVELAVREEDAPPEEGVRPDTGEPLHARYGLVLDL
mmetsp:Transcript_5657/g.22337  ORF Transcript_5657/g.22337 Transcript_5657/m.22337 type:complete len:276 (-) Transcript_5657:172-999(-)